MDLPRRSSIQSSYFIIIVSYVRTRRFRPGPLKHQDCFNYLFWFGSEIYKIKTFEHEHYSADICYCHNHDELKITNIQVKCAIYGRYRVFP